MSSIGNSRDTTDDESKMSPYLRNLRRYGGRDEELAKARKQVLKNRKKVRKVREKAGG